MPLGKRFGDDEESRFCGVEITFARDLQATLHESLIGGFDYILLPLAHPRNERRAKESLPEGSPLPPPFARSDLLLSSSQWSSQVVGVLSPWIDLDSDCPHVRRDGESALKQELAWATHLSLQACVAPTPRGLDMVNYARHVSNFLMSGVSMQVWLRIPLVSGEMLRAEGTDAEDEVFLTRHPIIRRPMYADPWEWWNMFRSICEHNSLLGVALDIPASLPAKSSWLRWLGEPVKVAILPTSVFLTNRKGYPTLSKAHQELITTLFDHKVQVVIRGKSFHDKPVPDTLRGKSLTAEQTDVLQELQATGSAGPARHPLRPYLEYVSYLYRRAPPPTDQDIFEVGYRDYLQAPLQPLMDHLESQTYETFEKDWTKYAVYQQAVYRALMDRVAAGVAGGSGGGSTVLMVVGAGRGPLVRASLRAAADAGASIRVYAVEKNPNAVITLQSLAEHEGWGDAVTIVSGDMRLWEAPEKADILVSELLGSFGDNELSPECLDGAQRFLKEGGISIPCKYTSYAVPITASKLYNDVKAYGDLAHFETAYVVKLHSIFPLGQPQEVFSFVHPNHDKPINNHRYTKLEFELPLDAGSAVIHGFGGYFDVQLYKEVNLSIHPATHTPNMFSWFAIYFPVRTPMYVPAGSKVQAHFWRRVGPTKVWYEWAITAPDVTPLHNPGGRSYWVGL